MNELTYSERQHAAIVYVIADIVEDDHDGLGATSYSYIPHQGYISLKWAKYHAREDWRRRNFDKSEGLEFKWRDDLGTDILSYSYLKEQTTPNNGYISASGLAVVTHAKTEMVRTEDVDICAILEIPILNCRIIDTEELT